MQARVTKSAQQLTLFGHYTTESSSDDGADPLLTTHHRKPLKSGRLRTVDTLVVRRMDWSHEFVYSAKGKYKTLTVPDFVSGYMMIMDKQKSEIKTSMSTHLAELMADTELYGWLYHAMWLQQLEQGPASWKYTELRSSYCHTLVWHRPATGSKQALAAP